MSNNKEISIVDQRYSMVQQGEASLAKTGKGFKNIEEIRQVLNEWEQELENSGNTLEGITRDMRIDHADEFRQKLWGGV